MIAPRANAILYVTSRDRAWRKLPKNFPPWKTTYGYYAKWRRDGTWQKIRNVIGCELSR
ncbi:MAG: transposase [Thermoguttaceae bacterium]